MSLKYLTEAHRTFLKQSIGMVLFLGFQLLISMMETGLFVMQRKV
jgi:hypothetical protein